MHKTTHMANMAHRHHRAAKKNAIKSIPSKKQYVILDSNHKPDLRNEFGGAKVTRNGAQHTVWLSDKTARFYLDSGAISPVVNDVVKKRDETVKIRASDKTSNL